jgi:hypothetical protein
MYRPLTCLNMFLWNVDWLHGVISQKMELFLDRCKYRRFGGAYYLQFTEQVGSSGRGANLCTGCTWFDPRPEHTLSSVPPAECWDSTLNYAKTASSSSLTILPFKTVFGVEKYYPRFGRKHYLGIVGMQYLRSKRRHSVRVSYNSHSELWLVLWTELTDRLG